ncbi:Ligand-Gated ion Channel [Caenorhabditis elegans]|uniref:Ligand-Gated ion Channel n=1 Tax=Caenorhabditis elegans TaxID=6239 RepID=A0A4V0IK93_CAEEL|nr:Ligand-Gated ion Channel [Caenorhabditis elegans]VTW47526.1 Ligand-Gated ion Channel [Caenorhabditis elegans]
MLLVSSIFLLLYRNSPKVEASRSEPVPIYLDNLLNAGRQVYDNQSPPVQHDKEEVTVVELAMYIEGMSSFRTQTMDFQLDVYFQQFWRDPRLAHNETRRVLVKDKAVLHKMWKPDVYFANARIAEFHEVTQPNFLVWIQPDGSILYDTRISMVVVCTLNLEKWPLDSQRCHLRILSYAYTTEQLVIKWKEDEPITRNPNIAMSDMHIVDLYPGLCDGNYSTGTWSCVTAEFFVKREITHHVMQSYVPTTLIVVISWFSFWLDVEAVPARVSLAITTLLTLSTQANAARMALPEVSYMKAIDVWMGACMMFVFGVMIEFTIVNYAQRQVMASSLESVKSGNAEKKPSRGDLGAHARHLFLRLRTNERQHLVEDPPEQIAMNDTAYDTVSQAYSNSFSDEEAAPVVQPPQNEDAEAQEEVWAEQKETNLSEVWKESDPAERLAHWNEKENDASSPLMGNGRAHVRYGAAEKMKNRKCNDSSRKKEKWSSAIKQIQKHKKIAGRNRAKKIDQTSRWIFPLTFIIFNLTYWIYYLYWKE